jgi:F-box/TPR repeat protein Pof3
MLENIAKACGDLTELEFISLPHAMSSTLIEIVQHAPKLEKFVVHPQITIDTVAQVLNNSPSLKHVAFNTVRGSLNIPNWRGPFPNLMSCKIHLDRTALRGFGTIETLIERAGALKSLDVGGFILPTIFIPKASAPNPPLTTLILHQVQLTQFPYLPPTLHKLVIEAEGASEVTDERDVLISRAPALRHLSLVHVNGIYAKWFPAFLDFYIDPDSNSREVQLLDDTVPLEHLTLRGLPASPEDGLFINDRSLLFTDYTSSSFHSSRILTPALKHLDIATHRCNDDEIEHLLKHKVSGLRSIDLSYTQITGASIKMLVDGLPALRRIMADECPKINGRDAIEYAMRKGVAVSRSMSESKGSRKIRYG